MADVVIIRRQSQRDYAKRLVDAAEPGTAITIRPATRSVEQNAKMWAMLSDVSRAQPDGRQHTPEVWKELFMHACGHACRFEVGLDGLPFPAGFRSSRLTVRQMADLIEFISAYGAEHGVRWSHDAVPEMMEA